MKEDGLYDDISDTEYHASHAYSRSDLMLLEQCPLKLDYKKKNLPKEATAAMNFGTLYHTMILEPEYFTERFKIKPKLFKLPPKLLKKDVGAEAFEQNKVERERITIKNNEILARYEGHGNDKIEISQADYDKANAMRAQLMSNQDIKLVFSQLTHVEPSIYWTCKETGLRFKSRPDALATINGALVAVDLKTTYDNSPRKMNYSARDYGYYLQAAMIYEAMESLNKPISDCIFIAQEKEPPYCEGVHMIEPRSLNYARQEFQKLKHKLKECIKWDKWPSYAPNLWELPSYLLGDLENE